MGSPTHARRIIDGEVRWDFNNLKIPGEFSFLLLYWEWTEDVLARCASRLQSSNIYSAVCASLSTYGPNPHIIRAFYESWIPSTSTLHMAEGEWSISLWDLHKLGGLSISRHACDETIPSFNEMEARDKDGGKLISRALEHLFGTYCFLADQPDYKSGVLLTKWIIFWCKRQTVYNKSLGNLDSQNGNSTEAYTQSHRIDPQEVSRMDTRRVEYFFSKLGIEDEAEKKTTYLEAFLSCWLCVFVLPEEKKVIRPKTFEVAVSMARGSTFSLALVVLANIYRGFNILTLSSTSTTSRNIFPAHYLYAWLA